MLKHASTFASSISTPYPRILSAFRNKHSNEPSPQPGSRTLAPGFTHSAIAAKSGRVSREKLPGSVTDCWIAMLTGNSDCEQSHSGMHGDRPGYHDYRCVHLRVREKR